MTDQLMSLEDIADHENNFRHCEERDWPELELLCQTARAAHEWKAQCETLFQLGDATGKEFRKAREENESLRKDISKALKDSQEFLASTFCEKHKDEVEKESFAEFLSKHVCERCVKERLAAKDKEIAGLKEILQVARDALLTCEFPDEVEHVWWFDEDAVSNAILKLEASE